MIAPVAPRRGLDRRPGRTGRRRPRPTPRPDPHVPANATRDEVRSVALGWLAHPEDVIALLACEEEPRGHGAKTRKAVVHVHLHQEVLDDGDGVARVEEVGPTLLVELTQLLGHARVSLAPVIDLNETISVNGYEHPKRSRPAPAPHPRRRLPPRPRRSAAIPTRTTRPLPSDGPPGQTGDHNAAPLSRSNHRAKTHLDYRSPQLGLGRYLWRTPHGLTIVGPNGTHEIDPAQAFTLERPGALDAALDQIEAQRTDGV